MVAAWKAAGLSYNKYLSIAAQVVRRSLKDKPRLAAERRGQLELKFSKWESGKQGEAQDLAKAGGQQ